MKILGRFIIAIVVVVVVALIVLRITGLNPKDRRPGLWLTGTVITAPVSDWAFTDKIPVVQLQTRTRYGLPHSVNIWCVEYNNQLYLHSGFPAGTVFPSGKAWTRDITRDPHVRVKIGNQLYDGIAMVVTDPAEIAMLNQATSKKYPPLTGTAYYFRILPAAGQASAFRSTVSRWPTAS